LQFSLEITGPDVRSIEFIYHPVEDLMNMVEISVGIRVQDMVFVPLPMEAMDGVFIREDWGMN
jgi:hypothetical protein